MCLADSLSSQRPSAAAISESNPCNEPDHISCGDGNTCLIVHRTRTTWFDAGQHCLDIGGRLVVINTRCVHAILAMYLTDVDAKSHFWMSYTNSRWTKSNGTYNVQRTTYNVQRTTYNVQRTTYNVQRTTYNVQRTMNRRSTYSKAGVEQVLLPVLPGDVKYLPTLFRRRSKLLFSYSVCPTIIDLHHFHTKSTSLNI